MKLTWWMKVLAAAALSAGLAGCVFSSSDDDGGGTTEGSSQPAETEAATAESGGGEAAAEPASQPQEAAPPASTELSNDSVNDSSMFPGFGGVTWLHHNVSGWPETASLNASVRGSTLRLAYDKANVWPVGYPIGGVALVGNAWVFFQRDGKWYGGTFEWLKPGQIDKQKSAVNGGQIGHSAASGWTPQSGEVYGFMVSGFARSRTRNIEERSNISWLTWP